MLETSGIPETQWQPITLPDDATHADLAKAHDEGVDSQGRTEEELYPAKQAVIDSAEHYKKEVDQANYIFEVNKFKDGRSEEASDRLGKDSQELNSVKEQLERVSTEIQQKNTEGYKAALTSTKYCYELEKVLTNIDGAEDNKTITVEQATELRAVGETRRAEIQQKNTEDFKQAIESFRSQEGIDALLVDIDRSADSGRILEESREMLRKEALARRPGLPPKLEA